MPAPPCGNYGDVTGDGDVTITDAMYISQYLIGSRTLTADQLIRANVKGYGSVSSLDETLIADYVAGTITTFPVCGVTPPPPPTAITCNEATSHFSSGCKLLLHYDSDKDGKVSSMDASRARTDGMTNEEVSFILSASAAGSINALCSGCYGAPAPPPPTPPGNETRTMSLTEGNHSIQVSLSGYNTLNATINVSSTGVTCTVGPCGTTGPPGVTTSGWTVTAYLKTATTVSDVCTWIDSIGGWKNLQWSSHVLEAYYVYIGASGHSVGFSPVTWNDVLGLYYYYINDPMAGNGKIGCGT